MREFKVDVYKVLKDPLLLTISESLDELEEICEEEVKTIASDCSDFARPRFDNANGVTVSETRRPTKSATGSDEANVGLTITSDPYWSVPEDADFLRLVQLHGHNSSKIADALMAKAPEDVEKHLTQNVQSGRVASAAADAKANHEEAS